MGLKFLGVSYSADFAATGMVISKWAPLNETAIFIAILPSFTSISSIITSGVSGVLCASSTFGWKWSFYLHAVSGFILFVTWFLLYKDDPTLHKSVSSKELLKIQKSKSEAHIKDNKIVPYLKIFTSPVIRTVWFCAFTELSTFILISQYAPAYFREVLGFDIVTIGLLNGIMTAIHIPFRFVCAFLSDKISFIPAKHNITAVVCLAILECFMSFNSGGFYKCGTLHARQFSSTVISAIQFSKSPS
ncbi:unnamed protein product [Caenorhabditis nigoni]